MSYTLSHSSDETALLGNGDNDLCLQKSSGLEIADVVDNLREEERSASFSLRPSLVLSFSYLIIMRESATSTQAERSFGQ